MIRLPRPTTGSLESFRVCVNRVSNADLKRRLTSVEGHIDGAAQNFENAASSENLHQLPLEIGVIGIVSKEEMVWLYKSQLVDKKSPGRKIYDEIILSAKGGVCPLCGHRSALTLDHHFPKAKFSPLAVTPINLVPSCRDCNFDKKTSASNLDTEQSIHPYFDDFETDRWINARVNERQQISVDFLVNPPTHWSDKKKGRANFHFTTLKLRRFYSVWASNELVCMRHYFHTQFSAKGPQGMSDDLRVMANSRIAVNQNSWQSALYDALSSNRWFCEGGYTNIPRP